jgi:hypothetical protein
VNISGYSLQYATSTGTSFTRCNIIAANTIIEPGKYFLIQLGTTNSTVGGAIPTPDATPTCNVNIAASVGKLALVSNTTTLDGTTCPPTGATIVDFVGYGTGTDCSEGNAPAPAPANNQSSIQRIPGEQTIQTIMQLILVQLVLRRRGIRTRQLPRQLMSAGV